MKKACSLCAFVVYKYYRISNPKNRYHLHTIQACYTWKDNPLTGKTIFLNENVSSIAILETIKNIYILVSLQLSSYLICN